MTDKPAHVVSREPLSLVLRALIGVGAAGLAIGGVVLIAEGVGRMARAASAIVRHAGEPVSSVVMKATDECLFGVLLAIIAANIAFGFCFAPESAARRGVPAFMRASSLHELKTTFCQVIVVYMIVDFATDLPEADKLDVRLLYFPLTILIVSAAVWVSAATHRAHGGEKLQGEPR